MKPATTAVRNIIEENVSVRAVPKLIAEWEHNRFSPIESIVASPENPLSETEWNGVYDLNSIGLPNRPRTGIAKARLSEPIRLAAGYRDAPQAARFYAASFDDPYKYWSSWNRTKLAPVATNDYEFGAPIKVTLMYTEAVIANKVVVGFETSYASPKSYDIQVTEVAEPVEADWKTISSNGILDSLGQVTLWRKNDLSDTWGKTPVYDSPAWVHGIRLVVRSMTEAYSNLDVIQMGARLENDLSDFVISYDKTFEVSERSFIAPLGRASSNVASVELTNLDLRFNNDNLDSIYYGLIDKKVKFTLDLSVDARPSGSEDERLREFTMWVDNWGGQDQDSVQVALKDSSVLLQEIQMPKVFWENMTVGAVIWQIMDTLGYTNYNYSRDDLDNGQVIPYFWAIEGTVWDQISQLAEGTQTAVYFDEWDVMQIKSRKSMFKAGAAVNWNFDAVQNGQKLPDIIDLSTDDSLVVNQVDIQYKPAQFSDFNNGLPKMETVWEPEDDTVVLRASALTRDLPDNGTSIWIKQDQAAYWPYESLVNIRGEILRYKGKEYAWNKPGGGTGYEIVYSLEDKQKVDAKSDPNKVWANSFTGKLMIEQRGIGGSGVAQHKVKPAGYTGVMTNYFNTLFQPVNPPGAGMNVNDGILTLQPPFNAGVHDYFLVKHESTIPSNDITYGTRFRFPSANLNGDWMTAGIWVAGDWGDAGYFIEISPTITAEQEGRQWRHEISMVLMPGDAPHRPWDSSYEGNRKGWPANILPDQWYDLDVRYAVRSNGTAVIEVFLNGVWAGDWFVPVADRPPNDGKFGLFTRWNCKCDFEFLYAVDHTNAPSDLPDQSSFLDLVSGGFTSGYIEREWRYGYYQTLNRGPDHEGGYWFPALNSRANYALDEFGPVVHEMREFTVNFKEDNIPVGHSYLYISNESQVACTDYNADAFGAKFTLVNTSRRDAILKGEDKITFGDGNPIDQKIFVYGRSLYQDEDKQLLKRDEQSIRRKGLVNLTFDNRWIQTETAANDLGQWVVDLWADGSEEISMNIFGNPLVQLGDLGTVNYPVKDMAPGTHKYYIVQLKNEFQDGFTTSLILRRARI